jgi:hypothetical protein
VDEETKPDRRNPVVLDAPAAPPVCKPSPLRDHLTQEELQRRFLEEMEKLPVQNRDDGFSGRDHDKILYPRRR